MVIPRTLVFNNPYTRLVYLHDGEHVPGEALDLLLHGGLLLGGHRGDLRRASSTSGSTRGSTGGRGGAGSWCGGGAIRSGGGTS
jgi:hypothetical protein